MANKKYYSYDYEEITLNDLKRGYFLDGKKKYEITGSVKTIKECRNGQLFKIPNSKGEITNTFSDSPVAKRYSRVWLKVPKGYRGWSDSSSRGSAMIVPYDDPSGENSYIQLNQEVYAFNVYLVL